MISWPPNPILLAENRKPSKKIYTKQTQPEQLKILLNTFGRQGEADFLLTLRAVQSNANKLAVAIKCKYWTTHILNPLLQCKQLWSEHF